MVVIGASISHDGTISVVRDGKHVFSIAEERLNRIKSYIGFPFQALRYLVDRRVVEPREVGLLAIPTNLFSSDLKWDMAFSLTEDKLYYDLQNEKRPADFYLADREWESVDSGKEYKRYAESKLQLLLRTVGISAPVKFVNHHLAHAASAYYASGKNLALAITLDGEGDRLSGSVNICRDGTIHPIHTEPVHASLGYLYSFVTQRCGFKISRHEGKITGLAAYGDHKKREACFGKEVSIENGSIRYQRIPHGLLKRAVSRLKHSLDRGRNKTHWETIIEDCGSDLSKEDLSAAVQYLLEERIKEYVRFWMEKTQIYDLVIAGGVFANVKVNQVIGDLPGTKSLFVFPDMGDGGGAFGAAALAYFDQHEFSPAESKLEHVYLGPSYSGDVIEDCLKTEKAIAYRKSHRVEAETAELIHEGRVVGWFQGGMECGPRALGNRSILARATDRSINDRLNRRLGRTEFMPFAPSCLYEAADDIFDIGKEGLKRPAEFMTITFRLKPEWESKVPAVAHVDRTARPHLVRREANGKFYEVLRQYQRISGLPLFINTSFNIHEEPIVCQPREAITALKMGAIDILVMGDFLCRPIS